MARFARSRFAVAPGSTPTAVEPSSGPLAQAATDASAARPPGAAIGVGLLVALPGVVTVYASFQAGGFFAGTPALLAVLLGLLLVGRITLADEPFAGFGRGLAIATASLGLYCAWILLSASWSDSSARAMIEFDRALLYWLLLVLLGSLRRDDARVAWALRAVAIAIVSVCAVALLTRLFPDAISVAPEVAERRLSYPLTYWNALGLMAAIGIVLSTHLAASEREPVALRLLGAGALPLLATTLYFTFSRGAMIVAVGGLVVYALVARPRSLPLAVLAAGPAVVATLISAYGADLLAGDEPTTAAAADQGGDVAVVVVLAVLGAVALRALCLPLDERLRRVEVSRSARRRGALAGVAAAAVAALVLVVAFDVVGEVSDRIDGFVDESPARSSEDDSRDDLRSRLSAPGNNGRIEQWEVAWNGFADAPVLGNGAGTSGLLWARERESTLKAEDSHSVYLETLAELGIVGGLLLGTTLAAILLAFARRARGPNRHVYAALLAAGLVWAVHAGVDWDWEMPATGMWLFALGGMALATSSERRLELGRFPRVALGVGCLALLVTPALMAVSQGHLNRAVEAFKAGDCATASRAAVDAARTVSARPQAYQIMGYCNSRAGLDALAIEVFQTAIARDPDNWESYYGLALAQASAGEDPLPALRAARALNPREELVRDAISEFRSTDDPQQWRRRASEARLPIL